MKRELFAAFTALALSCALPAAAHGSDAPEGGEADLAAFAGRVPCRSFDGIRFCEGGIERRVPSWDGVPLDLSLGLPASGRGPFPLIVLLHGWGGSKAAAKEIVDWSKAGYATLAYSARGFGHSCGSPESRRAAREACMRGWTHVADPRFEARDTQHLAGILADEGLADPRRIGVTGGSYGGAQSLQLAMLRDRVRMPDGSYAPWRSPSRGLPLRIAAAVPLIPWSDLAYALAPNGRALDSAPAAPEQLREPPGVLKASFTTGLFALGSVTGYYAPVGADPGADLLTWYAVLSGAGTSTAADLVPGVLRELQRNHSAYGMELPHPPAPTLVSSGFADDLFPADEALRWAAHVRARQPAAVIAQLHFDYGHERGQGKPEDMARLSARTRAWMDRWVMGDRKARPLRGVEVLSQACPAELQSEGPFWAPEWHALARGEQRLEAPFPRLLATVSGDPLTGRGSDPLAGAGPCAVLAPVAAPGSAAWSFPAAEDEGFLLMGSPSITATITGAGPDTALQARLWDVAPDGGGQVLVARGSFRPSAGRQELQLHPNAYRFAAGHIPKLELLGLDVPYARPGNSPAALLISGVQIRLPVR